LRNNPGGLLNQAISVSDFFLDKNQLIVYTKGRSRLQNKQYLSKYAPIWNKDHNLIVLVNEGSASGSEIVAGALQDNQRALILGTKTFGKGTVQELIQLSGDSMAKVTVAHWRLPNGDILEKNGLIPDFEVELTEEDIESDKDPQLEKAFEVLKKQL